MGSLTYSVIVYHNVALVNYHLRVDSCAVLTIVVVHEHRHRHGIGSTSGIVMRDVHSIVSVITVAKVPHHTVTLVVDGGIKGNIFVSTEVVVFQFCAEDIVDIHLLAEECGLGADRVSVCFPTASTIHVRHESLAAV